MQKASTGLVTSRMNFWRCSEDVAYSLDPSSGAGLEELLIVLDTSRAVLGS